MNPVEFASIRSPEAAFVAGLVVSLHCAGMCGPLACVLMPVQGESADRTAVSAGYQISRLASYAVLGAVAGGLGSEPLRWFSQSALRWTPWLMVALFLALAFRWDRWLPRVPAGGRWAWRIQARLGRRSRTAAGVALGLATPLLPCGPLYFVVALALFAGSASAGAELMLAFGLGTAPLLWFVQSRVGWIRTKLSPAWLDRTRVVLGLAAACVIAWRLRATLGLPGPAPGSLVCH